MIDMKNKTLKALPLMLPLLLLTVAAQAQEAADGGANPYFYDNFLFWSLAALAGTVIVAAIVALFHLLNVPPPPPSLSLHLSPGPRLALLICLVLGRAMPEACAISGLALRTSCESC